MDISQTPQFQKYEEIKVKFLSNLSLDHYNLYQKFDTIKEIEDLIMEQHSMDSSQRPIITKPDDLDDLFAFSSKTGALIIDYRINVGDDVTTYDLYIINKDVYTQFEQLIKG